MSFNEISIKEILEKNLLRKTPARVAILKLFYGECQAFAHADLEEVLLGKYDRVTIYRTLASFEEKGLIHKVYDNSGISKYALCHTNCSEISHHDDHVHFNCTSCGNTYCIEEAIIPPVNIPGNFKAKNIYLVAEGICETCSPE